MNIIRLIFLLMSFGASLNAQILWQIFPDKTVKWNYYDGEEFNNGKLNEEKWLTNLPWSRPVFTQDIIFLKENVRFKDGYLQLYIEKADSLFKIESHELDTVYLKKNNMPIINKNMVRIKYSGALLWSKKKYKYGYFEIKFKAPEGQGLWPAFWLYGANPNNEIDFYELKGEKEKALHLNAHCPDGCSNYKEGWFGYRKSWGHWVETTEKLKDSYNVVAGEWTPEYVKWYLNGVLIGYFKHTYEVDMWLSAGTGLAKDGGPFKPGPNEKTPFPNFYNIDYIRIYKTDTAINYKEVKRNVESVTDTSINTDTILFTAKNARKKLKNNSDKKIKPGGVITFSVTQLTRTKINFRVLGANEKDKISITISGNKSRFRQQFVLDGNKEYSVSVPPDDKIWIEAVINGQTIKDHIIIQ